MIDTTDTIALETGAKVVMDTIKTEVVIGIGIKVVTGIVKINHIEAEVKKEEETGVMIVSEIKVDLNIIILEEAEAGMDLEKTNMKNSMYNLFCS